MEWIQSLLDSSTTPMWTAFLLGLLTALSPCPLATNIAAVGYIGRQAGDRRRAFRCGVLYMLGRIVGYAGLGVVLIMLFRAGAGAFGLQRAISVWGGRLLGPALLFAGIFLLFGGRLRLPGIEFRGGERIASRGDSGALLLGLLFSLAFCPSSGVFYFGMLIPMSTSAAGGYLLPVLFAVGTALPVLVAAWVLAFGMQHLGTFYGRMQDIRRWLNLLAGLLFLLVGICQCVTTFL